ncbi:long-chain fatty acid--CoA ligase [Saccharothrix sp. NRRL B-16348]|uniref:fatty acyl-AMP ligase n=1 Tax=Saccharothrix sp. NRRL B-16348 TaxID=1415542 RepID=UPI0006AFE1F8|nr:fatty acyl-AMP ligase [Saccharothrix sp. NRRL B-16348]KOX21381.1 long-chain fatty acid--CoA ligase [Saccharothrix sp. NRRL B-16348]
MSRFVDTMVATASGAGGQTRGMTTGEPNAPVRRSWAEVHQQATRMAGALVADGVARGESIAVLAGDPAEIAPAVQAVWLAGGSTTMLHQPTARTDLAEWAGDTLRVLTMIGAKLVLLGAPFDALSGVLDEHGVSYRRLAELDGEPLAAPVDVDEDLPALLQLTSGSTADPKAVRITHGNLWSNAKAMEIAAELDPETDRMVSWLPLFHDMGMVGFLTVPMLFGIDLVKVTPPDFLGRPTLWPDLISRYQGTITAAPNFAYAIAARRMQGVDDGAFDLSTLRIALNGAEPIDPAAVKTFTDAGARFGLRPECVLCAYGMAETTLGVAFAPVFTGLSVDVVDPEQLEAGHRAVPVAADSPNARAFPLLGPPLPGLEVQVVDESGKVLGEREVGQLRVRGEAVTPGYLTVTGPRDTQDAEGWLDTGDEGYVVDGQVVVCGRRKDVIIMGGRNIYPTDIERAATAVEGVRAGNAVAVRLDAGTRRERFAVVVESKLAGEEDAVRALSKEISARVVDAVGLRPFSVVVLKPGSLPKTPSGKLRRSAAAGLVPTV